MDVDTSSTHPAAVPSENGATNAINQPASDSDQQVQVENHQLVTIGVGAVSELGLVAQAASTVGAYQPAPTGSPALSLPDTSLSAASPAASAVGMRLPASCLHPLNMATSASPLLSPKLPSRQPLSAQQCSLTGAGLSTAIAWRETSFKIQTEAGQGGSIFHVLVRAKGTKFRAKVVDRNDGSYLVVYKPTVAGKCVISVSLNGDALPGSPHTCLVSDALAVAELCSAQGAGLTQATSWQQESFQVSFRDAQGQVAPAAELDVFVRPVVPKETHANRKDGSQSPLSFNALNGMPVGSKPLLVRSAISPDAPRVGQLMPGTTLRILKLEHLAEERILCACVMLSHDEADGQSWRELYAQLPDWRARSWRKHEKEKKAHMDVQDALREIAQAEAAEAAKKEAEAEEERKRLELQLQAEQERRAAEEAQAREEARIERERRKKEAKKKKEASKEEEKSSKGGKAAKAAKAKTNKGKTLPVTEKARPPSTGAAPPASLSMNASSRASCLSVIDPQPSVQPASAAVGTAPGGDGEEQSFLAEGKEMGASLRDLQPALVGTLAGAPAPIDASGSADRSYNGHMMEVIAQNEPRCALSSVPSLPLPAQEQPRYGWVTVARDGQQCVSNVVEKLEPRERQRMAKHWKHRITINSERERARSFAMDEDRLSRVKSEADLADIDDMVRARNAFIQELETDPRRICFAYGGIRPGRAGAKGRLFNAHTITYAIGAAGRYELHVCLRRNSAPLPGSPFPLVVSSGPAFPMASKLPLPLLGAFELVKSEDGVGNIARCACRVIFQTRDKMGNPCTTGGAEVQAGASAAHGGVQSRCTDLGNGKYELEFLSDASRGAQEVYVKIDGLHVIGSPTKLRLTSATPDVTKSEVLAFPSKVEAGIVTKVRIKCKDSSGNPALAHALLFGVTLIPEGDKVSEWEHYPAHPTRQSVAGEELELYFAPTIAGECKAYLWAVEGGARRRLGQQHTQARRQSVVGLRRRSHEGPPGTTTKSMPAITGAPAATMTPSSTNAGEAGTGTGAHAAGNVAQRRNATTLPLISDLLERSTTDASDAATRVRRRSVSRDSIAEVEPMVPTPGLGKARKLLAKGKGEPFFPMKVVAGPASFAHSRIEGLLLSTHGNWQNVPLEDGEVKEERLSKPQGTKAMKKGIAAGGRDQERCGLLVGDTIRFMPIILDEFGNSATITDDRMNISISSHSGEEVLRAHQTSIRGHPVYDVRYEIKRRGVHTLWVLVDGTNVTGSPISWNARLPDKSASGAQHPVPDVGDIVVGSDQMPPPAGVTTEDVVP